MTDEERKTTRQLREAAKALCEEVLQGKWDHLPDIHTKPTRDCIEMFEELQRRCPGHFFEDYRNAYCRSMVALG